MGRFTRRPNLQFGGSLRHCDTSVLQQMYGSRSSIPVWCEQDFSTPSNLNLALIPFYGIWGAAVATALAFTISSLNLNLAAWRWLGLRGGVLLGGAGPARSAVLLFAAASTTTAMPARADLLVVERDRITGSPSSVIRW